MSEEHVLVDEKCIARAEDCDDICNDDKECFDKCMRERGC